MTEDLLVVVYRKGSQECYNQQATAEDRSETERQTSNVRHLKGL